jgi:hypothetical protein
LLLGVAGGALFTDGSTNLCLLLAGSHELLELTEMRGIHPRISFSFGTAPRAAGYH